MEVSKKTYTGSFLSFFPSENTIFRELVRILCSTVFPWATVTLVTAGPLCCEKCRAPFSFTSLVFGLFKSDASVLLFLQHMPYIGKQYVIIFNPTQKCLQKIFHQITIHMKQAYKCKCVRHSTCLFSKKELVFLIIMEFSINENHSNHKHVTLLWFLGY